MKNILSMLIILSLFTGSLLSEETKIQKDTDLLLDDIIKCTEQIMIFELERLKEISLKNEIVEDNWPNIKAALLEESKSRINSLSWYALPDGSYYTVEKNKVSANLSSREYFSTLLDGKPVFGATVTGKTSGRKSLVIAYPVIKNGVLVGILGTSFYVNDIRKFLLKFICLENDMVFYIVNNDYVTILDSSDPDLTFDKPLEQNSESLKDAIKTIVSQEQGSVKYQWNNINKKADFKKSSLTQWHFVVSQSEK